MTTLTPTVLIGSSLFLQVTYLKLCFQSHLSLYFSGISEIKKGSRRIKSPCGT